MKQSVIDQLREKCREATDSPDGNYFAARLNLAIDEIERLQSEVERLRGITGNLAMDAEGAVYPPPNALRGRGFYHPDHMGVATLIFTQLFWYSDKACWGISCGGWEVPFAECFPTSEAAEAVGGK